MGRRLCSLRRGPMHFLLRTPSWIVEVRRCARLNCSLTCCCSRSLDAVQPDSRWLSERLVTGSVLVFHFHHRHHRSAVSQRTNPTFSLLIVLCLGPHVLAPIQSWVILLQVEDRFVFQGPNCQRSARHLPRRLLAGCWRLRNLYF